MSVVFPCTKLKWTFKEFIEKLLKIYGIDYINDSSIKFRSNPKTNFDSKFMDESYEALLYDFFDDSLEKSQ